MGPRSPFVLISASPTRHTHAVTYIFHLRLLQDYVISCRGLLYLHKHAQAVHNTHRRLHHHMLVSRITGGCIGALRLRSESLKVYRHKTRESSVTKILNRDSKGRPYCQCLNCFLLCVVTAGYSQEKFSLSG